MFTAGISIQRNIQSILQKSGIQWLTTFALQESVLLSINVSQTIKTHVLLLWTISPNCIHVLQSSFWKKLRGTSCIKSYCFLCFWETDEILDKLGNQVSRIFTSFSKFLKNFANSGENPRTNTFTKSARFQFQFLGIYMIVPILSRKIIFGMLFSGNDGLRCSKLQENWRKYFCQLWKTPIFIRVFVAGLLALPELPASITKSTISDGLLDVVFDVCSIGFVLLLWLCQLSSHQLLVISAFLGCRVILPQLITRLKRRFRC